MCKSTVLAAVLLLIPAVSRASSLDELLVEKGIITKSEAQAASGAAASKTYWKDGTRFEFPNEGFTVKLNTQIQTRYTFSDNDENAGEENTSSFSMRRVRLILSGTALHEEFSYYIQTDFVGGRGEDGVRTPELRDAWLEWRACDWAALRMGQFKPLVNRQYNASSSKLQFADRSIASEYFNLGRQPGLSAEHRSHDGQWLASAAVFNGFSDGEGLNKPGVDTRHTGVVSLRWNPMGKMNAYEEGDISWTEDASVSVGAAYAYSDATQADAGGQVDQDDISVDANLKWQGWSLHGEYFFRNINPDFAGSSDVEPSGFYAQIGYFLVPKKWEVAGRYSLVDCDDGAAADGICSGNDKVNQASAGVSYYWWNHTLKAQLNYEHINERVLGDGDDINSSKWIFQVSSYF